MVEGKRLSRSACCTPLGSGRSYDALSRPLTRREGVSGTKQDTLTTWTWGSSASAHEIGQLNAVQSVADATDTESYAYDSAGRLATRTIANTVDGGSYVYNYGYNSAGLLDTLTYPTSTSSYRLKLQYSYANGALSKIADAQNASTVFWQANSVTARGAIQKETLGNGVITQRSFDAVTGWLAALTSGPSSNTAGLQNESYLYDLIGNLTQRQQNLIGATENFYYDSLYRLDYSTRKVGTGTAATNLDLTYDLMGNITARTDVASNAAWTYSGTHKHQVLQAGSPAFTYTYDANGNAISRNGYAISWSSYNYPTQLATGSETVNLSYGPNRERWRISLTGSSGTETTYVYGNLLEKVVSSAGSDYRHYIYAGNNPVAILSRTSAGANNTRYVLEDHLNSVASIQNSSGTNVVSESYSAYGARRDPTSWSGSASAADLAASAAITRFGYTWQVALGSMGLNHLNGRVEDAYTGRFLSPDPYINEPGITQNYNRYSYVYNNPLSFSDPNGFWACDLLMGYTMAGVTGSGIFGGNNIEQAANGGGLDSHYDYSNMTAQAQRFLQPLGIGSTTPLLGGVALQLGSYERWGNSVLPYSLADTLCNNDSGCRLFDETGTSIQAYYSSLASMMPAVPDWGGMLERAGIAVGGAGVAASVAEPSAGARTLGSNWKVYPSGWNGNQYVSTLKLAKVARFVGQGTFAIGTTLDVASAMAGEKSWLHVGANAVVGGVATYSGTPGMIVGGAYFVADSFYPGGVAGLLTDYGNLATRMQLLDPLWNKD